MGRSQEELFTIKDIIEKASKDKDRFGNTAFVVMEEPFGDKEYERFIEYQANAECAQRHGLANQQRTYVKNASEMISAWCTRMRGHNVTFYFHGQTMAIVGSRMASTINNAIAPAIFTSGPESLDAIREKSSTTYWKKASVKATVDAILSFNNKQDILSSPACSGQARHVEFLLQDSVNDDLTWKSDIRSDHPLKRVCDYIDEWLSGKHTSKNQAFNLGDKLKGLTEPPFGLYQSYAPMAMVAFAMRKYVNQIYDTNGKPRSAQHLVGDVVEMFNAWEKDKSSNKLNFMFESKEAGKLSKNLIAMFSLKNLKGYSDISSLKDARWAITHEYAKEKGYPVWSLKYCSSEYNTDDMRTLIDNVIKVVSDPESMKNPALLSETISGYDKLKLEWGNLMVENKGTNYQDGFDNFMKSIDIVNVQDEELDEAFTYLKQHLEGEVGLWKEDEVKDSLKDWRMDKQYQESMRKQGSDTPSNPTPTLGGDTFPSGSGTGEQPAAYVIKMRENLSNWVKMTPSEEAKEVLSDIIKHGDSNVLDLIKKYVQGAN